MKTVIDSLNLQDLQLIHFACIASFRLFAIASGKQHFSRIGCAILKL
jgi:hypothetical protein